MAVLHFFTLPEFTGELSEGDLVRVEGLVRVVNNKGAVVGHRIAEVHARALHNDDLLTFMLPVGSVQTIHGEPVEDDKAAELDRVCDEVVAAVKGYLEGGGFEVRPGLIDIGGAELVRGTWAGLPHPSPSPRGRGGLDGQAEA